MKVISLQSFCFIVYWPCCVIGSERLFASYDFLQCSFHASNSWMHRTEIILLQKLCKHKKSTFSLQVQSTYLHYKFKVHTYMASSKYIHTLQVQSTYLRCKFKVHTYITSSKYIHTLQVQSTFITLQVQSTYTHCKFKVHTYIASSKYILTLQVQSTYLHYKFKVHTYMLRTYYHSCVCICLVSILFHISLHYDDIFHVCKSLIQLYMHANTCDTFFVVYF